MPNDILWELKENRIVSFELTQGGKTLTMTEMCDYCFEMSLDYSQVAQLIEELKALHSKMIHKISISHA